MSFRLVVNVPFGRFGFLVTGCCSCNWLKVTWLQPFKQKPTHVADSEKMCRRGKFGNVLSADIQSRNRRCVCMFLNARVLLVQKERGSSSSHDHYCATNALIVRLNLILTEDKMTTFSLNGRFHVDFVQKRE